MTEEQEILIESEEELIALFGNRGKTDFGLIAAYDWMVSGNADRDEDK